MDSILAFLARPVWPILLWAGLAASCAAAVVPPARATVGRPHARSAALQALRTLAVGLASAPLYGLAFEALGRADLLLGTALGILHGLFLFGMRKRAGKPAPFLRVTAAWVLYGTILGYLYPGPPA